MKTVLYLIRHGATEANLSSPPVLQGRRHNLSLTDFGVRQAEITRDFLAIRPIDACYSSPLRRAMQTACIIASPHGLRPKPIEALTECDVGHWEGLAWEDIRKRDAEAYARFMKNPAKHGYPGGESFADVSRRVSAALELLFRRHLGGAILVVGHHVVNRTYLAEVMGLPPEEARRVKLENCGISIVIRDAEHTAVATLNASFHLQGLAA
jgi:broad specificity phosphatase PhoE